MQKPAFCTAEGLCLLAGLRDVELEDALAYERAPLTPKTVTDTQELVTRIQKVKRLGYAIEDEECEEGTRCLAAPIYQNEAELLQL